MSVRTIDWIEIHTVDHCNNNCRWCNNHSPFSAPRVYQAEEYFPYLDLLGQKGIVFSVLSIMGGEPFLHPNLLEFCLKIKQRYLKPLMLSTNIFWLSETDIRFHRPLFGLVNTLHVTLYPNIVRNLGGTERVRRLLDRIQQDAPHMHMNVRRTEEHFSRLEFLPEPLCVDRHCFNAECTNLLADGRLARCGPGAYAHLNPHILPEFTRSRDMFYDLRQDSGDFWHWRHKWPLDACAHCNHFLKIRSPWKVEKGVRRKREYEGAYCTQIAQAMESRGDLEGALRKYMEVREISGASVPAYHKMASLSRRLHNEFLAKRFEALADKPACDAASETPPA